jgi:hypothetical protein
MTELCFLLTSWLYTCSEVGRVEGVTIHLSKGLRSDRLATAYKPHHYLRGVLHTTTNCKNWSRMVNWERYLAETLVACGISVIVCRYCLTLIGFVVRTYYPSHTSQRVSLGGGGTLPICFVQGTGTTVVLLRFRPHFKWKYHLPRREHINDDFQMQPSGKFCFKIEWPELNTWKHF